MRKIIMNKVIISVDPGASGSWAWQSLNGVVHVMNNGDTPRDILEQVRQMKDERDEDGSILTPDRFVCYMEDVGRGMPGQSSSATATFARHCGHLEMALMAEDIAIIKVLPTKWQKKLGIGKSTDYASKPAWKNAIKAKEQERHPTIKVTLKNADALGILDYALGVND